MACGYVVSASFFSKVEVMKPYIENQVSRIGVWLARWRRCGGVLGALWRRVIIG